MRHKRLKLSGLLLLGLGLTGLQAQTMYVNENTAIQTAYNLSNVRKITFSDGNATIHINDNTAGTYSLYGLRHLNFTDLSSGNTEQPLRFSATNLIAYPNPFNDLLYIDLTGLESKVGRINIFSFEGKMVHEYKTSGADLVALKPGALPHGIYFCRYSNDTEIKTVKIIKE